jgi:innexin
MLTSYLWKTRGMNDRYAINYFLCELLAFVNLIAQFIITDIFLDGDFRSYGWDVLLYYTQSSSVAFTKSAFHPMIYAFPRMTKCRFEYSGASGGWQLIDVFCLLELNIINEKLFLFLWYWYIILAILTIVTLSICLAMLLSPSFRNAWLQAQIRAFPTSFMDLMSKHHFPIEDWFIIFMLASNIDPIVMKDILENLAGRVHRFSLLMCAELTPSYAIYLSIQSN